MVYLGKRLRQRNNKYPNVNLQTGPVICISREVGCGGLNIAQLLASELDKHGNCKKWGVLSKAILEGNALELMREPNLLRSYLSGVDKELYDEVLSAFSYSHLDSELKIKQILIDLIVSFANDGHCIIVGRAAHIIAKEIDKALFIKLVAPYEWRLKHIMEVNNLNRVEAIDFMEEADNERQNYLKHFTNEFNNEVEFDLIINLSKMNITEVIDLIKFAALTKGLLESHSSKVEVF